MEVKWRWVDARRVKVKIDQEALTSEEVDGLIRALGRVRAKMHPRVQALVSDDAAMMTSASAPPELSDDPLPRPATVSDTLDIIADLLAKAPEPDREGAAGLLRTFAKIGQISRDGLALLMSPPTAKG